KRWTVVVCLELRRVQGRGDWRRSHVSYGGFGWKKRSGILRVGGRAAGGMPLARLFL
ncbi:hypothetical protein BHE74_00052064, partial [Ensete ventricosum]